MGFGVDKTILDFTGQLCQMGVGYTDLKVSQFHCMTTKMFLANFQLHDIYLIVIILAAYALCSGMVVMLLLQALNITKKMNNTYTIKMHAPPISRIFQKLQKQ